MNTHRENPFLHAYGTPHETVPFNRIELNDYEPAIREGMNEEDREIERITDNTEPPTFENTILALENSGALLERVTTVFFNLMSAETCDEMDALAEKMMPELSEHSNNISLNPKLFSRIKQVYAQKESLKLTAEEEQLLQKTYDGFMRNGADLSDSDKEIYRKLSAELSSLTLKFAQNHLKETNSFELVLTDKNELEGLPESTVEAARHAAEEKGKKDCWMFTLQAPSYVPFMKYSAKRGLRKKLYMAYNTQCTHANEYNNTEIVKRIVNIRMEMAQLLGFKDFADYVLRKRMAENSGNVYKLLNDLLDAYSPAARKEVEEVEKLARETEGENFILMPWDFSYYAEKLKDRKYSLNDEELRPYFELGKVKQGVFGLATRLYGITFKENKEIPVYHPDVQAYEVYDKDGSYLAVLYADFHPRAGKRSGAWMTSYKEQWTDAEGNNSRPHVSITTNFTKPTSDRPALLTFSEVTTFLHEFGHALHGIFANTRFKSMSGTNVYWDFVELPSQIMENFATEKEFLSTFARHYVTGEPIPEELIRRIIDSSNFNAAYACLRQVSFGLLDMAWYTRTSPFEGDVKAYEKESWTKAQTLPQPDETCMSVQFGHIMSGGYAAGYYSYKWAEVLDADAFSLFQEKGIFNSEVAQSFRDCILSKGGTEHPMTLYKRFRGQGPTIDALLRRNGIKQ
ncbi:M3 family metallopeptidase [Bacteroides gallinaceum]|uniref:M3 family metallopeptidase n=1 Tax=Bacteroides gallinaceum TaxID=1462571 RepID=UPI0025A427C2|nr:M3 family metallopeptidase [Bacteroides gallinaceum]MDM8209077.1 M3 family metallopeptidase [Bacteroides gallinaceum]